MTKKDPLDSKRRRTERFRFEVEDSSDAQAALADANLALFRAARDSPGGKAAEAALAQAKQALDACYGTVTLRALPPRVQLHFQQEVAERVAETEVAHAAAVAEAEAAGDPPPPDPEPPAPTWLADSLEIRLIAACDADGRSPERWATVLDLDGDWSLEDRTALLDACYTVNTRHTFDPTVLGKGWGARRS